MKEIQQYHLKKHLISRIATVLVVCFVVFSFTLSLNAMMGLNDQITVMMVDEKSNQGNDEQNADGNDVYFIAPSALHSVANPVSAPMVSFSDNSTKPFPKQVTPPPEYTC